MFLKSRKLAKRFCYSPLDRSTRISFKIKSINMGRLAIRILPFADWRFATFSNVLRSLAPWVRGMSRRGLADGSNYPGTQNIRKRIGYFEEGLREIHTALKPGPTFAPRVQALRARLLSHGHRRLGNGFSTGEGIRSPILCSCRYRDITTRAPKHRTDRRVAPPTRK